MQSHRTLRRRLRVVFADINELYVIGVDGCEHSGGMRVLRRRDPRFLQRQKKAPPHAGVRAAALKTAWAWRRHQFGPATWLAAALNALRVACGVYLHKRH